MSKRVKASNVLDANAVTKVDIVGQVIGRFWKTGPNKWDDFELEGIEDGEVLEIGAKNQIQIEPLGAKSEIRFRYRDGREVVRLSWVPTDEDEENIASGQWGERESEAATFFERILGTGPRDDPRDDMLEYFLDVITEPYSPESGFGYAAALVRQLRGTG